MDLLFATMGVGVQAFADNINGKTQRKNKGLIGSKLIVDVYMSSKKFNGKMTEDFRLLLGAQNLISGGQETSACCRDKRSGVVFPGKFIFISFFLKEQARFA